MMFSAKHRHGVGVHGEELAARFLVKSGYELIYRNYRKPWGEIDIIAKDRDGKLIFVEVKTIVNNQLEGLTPEDNLTKSKLGRLYRACEMFSAKHPDLVSEKMGWQLDLITLTLRQNPGSISSSPSLRAEGLSAANGLTISEKNCEIKHYPNI